ncbi:hypothetical protein Pmani_004612 [Petrolisthes manimaculis]|uniref:PHD-type domain-containing protein n=1 Tax=Petrolisthes manimaculis TaxID=1843537 RepID=A0AAE1QGC2_9EUCA|nr:hypothetical protein Pmani_004612 [Petrolisthes manimaculis]
MSSRDRGERKKECKRCGFMGRLNEEEKCTSCEEDDKKKTRPSHRRESTQSKDVCKQCDDEVTEEDAGIQCDHCKRWYHKNYEKVGEELYKKLERDIERLWFCKGCNSQVRKKLEGANKMNEDNIETKKELKELKEENKKGMAWMEKYEKNMEKDREGNEEEDNEKRYENNDMKRELGKIKEHMERMQKKLEEVDNKWKRMEEDLQESITKKVVEILEEREEKKKRIKNVVIYNLEEKDARNWREETENDQTACMDIFTNEMQVEDIEIVDTVRLGRKEQKEQGEERKPRALLVKQSNVRTKWELVVRAKKLKEARKESTKECLWCQT